MFEVSEPTVKCQDVTKNVNILEAAAGIANRPGDTSATYFAATPGYVKP